MTWIVACRDPFPNPLCSSRFVVGILELAEDDAPWLAASFGNALSRSEEEPQGKENAAHTSFHIISPEKGKNELSNRYGLGLMECRMIK